MVMNTSDVVDAVLEGAMFALPDLDELFMVDVFHFLKMDQLSHAPLAIGTQQA